MYQLSLLARVHCLGQFFWEEGTETGIWQVGEGVHEGLWGSGQGRGSGVCVHVGIQEASWRRWAHGNSSKGRGKILRQGADGAWAGQQAGGVVPGVAHSLPVTTTNVPGPQTSSFVMAWQA